MPKLITKSGDEYWFITDYDGPWQVYSSVTYSTGATRSAWGVVNVVQGKHREIGKPTAARSRSKINYYDRSCDKARELNYEYRNKTMLQCSSGYNRQDLREDLIGTLEFCITEAGSSCYNGGVSELVRRLDAINKEIKQTLAKLYDKDEKDYFYSGIMSKWALRLSKGGDIDLRKS